jgi:hypothetical protein
MHDRAEKPSIERKDKLATVFNQHRRRHHHHHHYDHRRMGEMKWFDQSDMQNENVHLMSFTRRTNV